ncbi:hypothetical protein Aduo_012454 [Ancylostoma duodenale]
MPSPTTPPVPIADPYGDLVRDLPAFNYDEDDDATFDAWIKRYGPVIDDRGSTLSEECKRNLIVDKLDRAAYKTYSTIRPSAEATRHRPSHNSPQPDEVIRTQEDTDLPKIRVSAEHMPSPVRIVCALPRIRQHDQEEVRGSLREGC